jgi:hypothetical protein
LELGLELGLVLKDGLELGFELGFLLVDGLELGLELGLPDGLELGLELGVADTTGRSGIIIFPHQHFFFHG